MFNNKNLVKPFLLLLMTGLVVISACSSMKKKQVVAEIGDEKIYLSEFENQYLKTVNNPDSAKLKPLQDKKDFLDLLIKFRLKVKDGKERGLANDPDIKNDINEYRKNFLSSFLLDKKIVEPNIKNLYEMKKNEVRASHILFNLPQNASPEDSIKAYKKAEDVLNELKNGADFNVIARKYSEDQTVAQNGGDLYYFTAGMTVPEFEDAVYKLKVGEYTKKPIRTMFGLHLIKLTDKKPRNESIRASHILIQDVKDSTGKVIDSIGTYNKIKDALARIKAGEDFGKVATEVSQDPGSAPKGGDLGFFDRRRMVQQFDSVAFTLKKDQVSQIIRTQFGWHIIKLTDVKEYQPFEKQKETLKSDFKKGKQYKDEYDKYLVKVEKDLDYKLDADGVKLFMSKFDSTKTLSTFNLDSLFANDKSVSVATYKNGKTTIADVLEYSNKNKDLANSFANYQTLNKLISGASELPLLNIMADKEKIDKDEDYTDLLNEYQSGLISFKIDQDQLWSKIKITNDEMLNYYNSNKDQYSYNENNEVKTKAFDDVKSEISNILQQNRFKDLEKEYIDGLKKKYPVKIYENVLEKAFKD
ncbi:peptidylprolyl isomerase [soil metagenome]